MNAFQAYWQQIPFPIELLLSVASPVITAFNALIMALSYYCLFNNKFAPAVLGP